MVALKRAADLSRNTDGLFNINQIEFIDALIDAYEASGRYPDAEKEALYAMRVEEAAYGRSSIKLLDRLDRLARWYESARRYTSERNVYERALGILANARPKRSAAGFACCGNRAFLPARNLLWSRRRRYGHHLQCGQRGRAGIQRRHTTASRRNLTEYRDRHHRRQSRPQ